MRVRPTERGLQHPVDNIEGQIRANLQSTPDRWFRVPEIDPHHEALQLCEPGPAQLGASRPCLFSRPHTEARQSASELSKVIELSSADDRVELAQQVSLAVVLAHARTVPLNVKPTSATGALLRSLLSESAPCAEVGLPGRRRFQPVMPSWCRHGPCVPTAPRRVCRRCREARRSRPVRGDGRPRVERS